MLGNGFKVCLECLDHVIFACRKLSRTHSQQHKATIQLWKHTFWQILIIAHSCRVDVLEHVFHCQNAKCETALPGRSQLWPEQTSIAWCPLWGYGVWVCVRVTVCVRECSWQRSWSNWAVVCKLHLSRERCS